MGDFCDRLHRGIRTSFKFAIVWGLSVKHQPQRVGLSHILDDEDVVQMLVAFIIVNVDDFVCLHE